VRNTALHANLASLQKEGNRIEHVSNWEARLKQIKQIQERFAQPYFFEDLADFMDKESKVDNEQKSEKKINVTLHK